MFFYVQLVKEYEDTRKHRFVFVWVTKYNSFFRLFAFMFMSKNAKLTFLSVFSFGDLFSLKVVDFSKYTILFNTCKERYIAYISVNTQRSGPPVLLMRRWIK